MIGLSIDPGEMTERVAIRQRTRVADGGGGYTTTWATVATVWAKVRPMRGDNRFAAAQLEARRDYEVTMRYRAGLSDEAVLVWRGQTLGVRFIADFGPRAGYLRIECEAGVTPEAAANA